MYLVGLTGGIGSGKTSVSSRLAELGAVVVDADAIVHELQSPGQPVLKEMVELLGPTILAPDGSLDRAAVAAIVFHDADQLAALGKIVHPRVREEITRRVIEQLTLDHVVVLDIPLLTESGWEGMEGTIVVDLDLEVAVERLIAHRGFSRADAEARIKNQAGRAERVATATWLIDNSGTSEELASAVSSLWEQLVANQLGHAAAGDDATTDDEATATRREE